MPPLASQASNQSKSCNRERRNGRKRYQANETSRCQMSAAGINNRYRISCQRTMPTPLGCHCITKTDWKTSVCNEMINFEPCSRKSLGLGDLFGCKFRRKTARYPSAVRSSFLDGFTLKLEHRGSGNNEDRLLLFRSDKPGCIGKIVFTSKLPVKSGGLPTRRQVRNELTAEERQLLASAKIHVVEIKEDFRGYDLGGLLFHEAISHLRKLYCEDCNDDLEQLEKENCSDEDKISSSSWFQHAENPVVVLDLDAEEDSRRYNKLLQFYENMGCSIRPQARILHLNNNDAETYRKIPMQMLIRPILRQRRRSSTVVKIQDSTADQTDSPPLRLSSSSLVGKGQFLPVRIVLASNGRQVNVARISESVTSGKSRQVSWVAIDECDNGISFQTTQGSRLYAAPSGTFLADGPINNLKWDCFKLRRVCDIDNSSVTDLKEDEGCHSCPEFKELWTLQTCQGSFLCVDKCNNNMLTTADYPIFWTVDEELLTLKCTRDTPMRRNYYHKFWLTQNLDYNRKMREKYLQFDNTLPLMDILEALDMAKSLSWLRFHRGGHTKDLSLRSFLFHCAETARLLGQPDWVQLIALLHDLGRLVPIMARTTVIDSQEFDWTLSSTAAVVGCANPLSAKFPEYQTLNSDLNNEQYNTNLGIYEEHCGLNNVLLTWSGSEYLYFMLKHNSVGIPEEGLAMLRFLPLKDWYKSSGVEHYQQLTDDADDDLKLFVSDFQRLVTQGKKTFLKDLCDYECNRLWEQFYHPICKKYQCDFKLQW